RLRIRPPSDQNSHETLQDCLSLLIAQDNSETKDSSVQFGSRFSLFENYQVQIEFIVRANWVGHPQFVPAQSSKEIEFWLELRAHQDIDRENMRTASGQPAENRLRCSSFIGFCRHWIILLSKPNYFAFCDEIGSSSVGVTHFYVFKV